MPVRPPMTIMAWLRWDATRRGLRSAGPGSIIEIGTGMGAMGCRLAERADYVGVERDVTSAEVARCRLGVAGTIVVGSVSELATHQRADLVCAFEVLEHIGDDRAALAEWVDRLRPGGWLLVSVPAHPHRFSVTDELVGHHRRYTAEALTDLVEAVGFEVVVVESYGFVVGHLLEAVRNALTRRRPPNADVGTAGSGRFHQPSQLAGALTWVIGLIGRLVQRLGGPRSPGIGWVLVARQRSANESGDALRGLR